MEKIRLANGNTYDIEGGASENNFSMVFDSLADATPVIESFTKENLAKVEFLTEGGEVCGVYTDKELDIAGVSLHENGIRVTYRLHDVQPEADEILNILLGGAE